VSQNTRSQRRGHCHRSAGRGRSRLTNSAGGDVGRGLREVRSAPPSKFLVTGLRHRDRTQRSEFIARLSREASVYGPSEAGNNARPSHVESLPLEQEHSPPWTAFEPSCVTVMTVLSDSRSSSGPCHCSSMTRHAERTCHRTAPSPSPHTPRNGACPSGLRSPFPVRNADPKHAR